MKYLKVSLIAGLSILFFLYISIFVFFKTEAYEFNLQLQKYAHVNLSKNSGWKKNVIKLLSTVTHTLPKYEGQVLERETHSLGVEGVPNSFWLDIFSFTDEVPTRQITVSSIEELRQVITQAAPGDMFILEPGEYLVSEKPLDILNSGNESAPIWLTASKPGTVTIQTSLQEGIRLSAQYWIMSNLSFVGDCDFDSSCEHAIHIVGDSDYVAVKGNRFKNYNAHIKANGNRQGEFPDFVLIEGNNFTNEWIRETSNPVTPIDVVGGEFWIVANNFIADFAKSYRNKVSVSYGAFLKGNGENGLFINNLVACSWKVPYGSAVDIRVGLSLGGGGTQGAFCVDKDCNFEHTKGIIESNTILNCNDVGIYLNKSRETKVQDNLLISTLGIDARYSVTSGTIIGNKISGRVKARDGANLIEIENTYNN